MFTGRRSESGIASAAAAGAEEDDDDERGDDQRGEGELQGSGAYGGGGSMPPRAARAEVGQRPEGVRLCTQAREEALGGFRSQQRSAWRARRAARRW